MKPENILKAVARVVVIGSLLSIVWILSGIYHSSAGKTVQVSAMPAAVPAPVVMPPRGTVPDAKTLQNDFSRIAEQSIPSVVVIRTGRTVRAWRRGGMYDRLHDYYYPSREKISTGQGSGFFINEHGHILTNYHIVKGQDFFRATLHDGREFEAKLIGSDPLSDLAVLKIDHPGKTPYLTFAESEKVKAGHWAIAIGAPFSLSHTVTVGVVSYNRRTVGLNAHENFIQFDASINPGNSGGPLLDIEGRVIGVNDFILSPAGGNIGLGFAIAGNLAHSICNDLIQSGRANRSWTGVMLSDVPERYRERNKLPKGVLIARMFRDSPAHKGGLKPGDLILKIDGQTVEEANKARLLIFSRRPGEVLLFRVYREGRELEIKVTAAPMPQYDDEEE